MSLILFLAVSAAVLLLAYRIYGRILARFLQLDDSVPTPAHTKRARIRP